MTEHDILASRIEFMSALTVPSVNAGVWLFAFNAAIARAAFYRGMCECEYRQYQSSPSALDCLIVTVLV